MDTDYQALQFEYVPSSDEDAREPVRHAVVVVGAGPVGLTAAIDLARQGVQTVLLDDDCKLAHGSRAICFAKRTLEIWDRLGCSAPMMEKGVSWNVGKVFFQDEAVYAFNLLPEPGHHRPAFINLQQYYCEGYLYAHGKRLKNLDVRWKNKVVGLEQKDGRVELTVETPRGTYKLQGEYVVACDGSRSPLRHMMGLQSKGQVFRDHFLIADVKMKADFPTERWFWFDPPFHRNQSVLLHRQPDNVWRIDFQLGWRADPEDEKKPEKVVPRIQALLGDKAEFDLEWVSVYTFTCSRMEKFRHGRVIFAGDSAHCVSPFGARGANSGVQDADNLAWKLKLVLGGLAPDGLLDSYAREREYAADENIRNSTRSTDFITPKSEASRLFRDAVLKLAKDHPFARCIVNSGRLSMPATLHGSSLNTPDCEPFAGSMVPGAPAADGPVGVDGRSDWFLSHIGGEFTLVLFGDIWAPEEIDVLRRLAGAPIPIRPIMVIAAGRRGMVPDVMTALEDTGGLLDQRYDARPGTCYLFRPDQHVCARWRKFDPNRVRAALARATCTA